jgi:hypothetical protein
MFRSIVLAIALLAAALEPAAAINKNAGTTGFNFLKIGVGARPAALGGAYVAVAGDIETVAWNPAGLLGVRQRQTAVSLSRYLVDTQSGFVSVALPADGRVWGVSLNYFTYGEMRRTDENGKDEGTFGAADLAAYLTAAQPLWKDWLALGLNLKAVYSSIDQYASDAYMVDAGLLVSGPLSGMNLGVSLSNIGFVRRGYVGQAKSTLPAHLRLGLAHRPAHAPLPVLLLADFNLPLPNDQDPYFAFGAEIRLPGGLYLRPGYSTQQTGSQGNDPLGLTAGVGFALQRYRLDYAFVSYPDLGEVHRVSLNGGF